MSLRASIPQNAQEVHNHRASKPISPPNGLNADDLDMLSARLLVPVLGGNCRSILCNALAKCFHIGVADKVSHQFNHGENLHKQIGAFIEPNPKSQNPFSGFCSLCSYEDGENSEILKPQHPHRGTTSLFGPNQCRPREGRNSSNAGPHCDFQSEKLSRTSKGTSE